MSDEPETKKPVQLSEFEEADDTTVPVIFRMSKTTYKKLGQIALDRETSRVALVREAIKEYLKKLETPPEQNPKISDRQFNKLLRYCVKDEGEGFEIDGEEGFCELFKAKGWKLKDLTPTQFDKLLDHLKVGYAGYWEKPEVDEWVERFEDLEPTDKQLEEIESIAEAEESE